MKTVMIDGDKCLGCRLCAIVCDLEVIDLRSDILAYVAFPEKCSGCKECELICPENAILIKE